MALRLVSEAEGMCNCCLKTESKKEGVSNVDFLFVPEENLLSMRRVLT